MKQAANILKAFLTATILVALCLMAPCKAKAQDCPQDSIEISLLTCGPGNEVYSLYGHTALRWHDMRTGDDFAFNYGVFNFKKSFFVLRFLFGHTDYELGVLPYDIFCEEYHRMGRWVVEQVIDLTPEEKTRLTNALWNNAKPENKTYRYNFFYDNCTTRARDMIELCINGKIEYAYDDGPSQPTYRQMIHEKTDGHPWAGFGDDLCIGVKADFRTDGREQQFLPENLMDAFSKAMIADADGHRPLVKETRQVVSAAQPAAGPSFPLTPMQCAYILLFISATIVFAEAKRKKTYKAWDVALLTCTSLAGIILVALLFSEHPTTSTNLQVLLLNPLPLFFIPSISRGEKAYWLISALLILMFFIGAMFQDYAEGMEIVALCLLTRCMANLALANRQHKNRTDKG